MLSKCEVEQQIRILLKQRGENVCKYTFEHDICKLTVCKSSCLFVVLNYHKFKDSLCGWNEYKTNKINKGLRRCNCHRCC